mgnify:CR=1 FL=1
MKLIQKNSFYFPQKVSHTKTRRFQKNNNNDWIEVHELNRSSSTIVLRQGQGQVIWERNTIQVTTIASDPP